MTSNNKNSSYQMPSKKSTGNMKYEVAQELGVELGGDTTAYDNGRVGGQITKELVNKAKKSTDTVSMKQEVAQELGVTLGANATARANGRVGGSMTKKLVDKAKNNNN